MIATVYMTDYEKNWMRKVNESILPTEVLHRSRELEYIRYVTEQNVKSKGNNMLLQKMKPDIMQRNKIEPLIFNTDPDEQAAYLTIIEWEKNEDNNNNQKSEVNFFILSRFEKFYSKCFVNKFSTLLLSHYRSESKFCEELDMDVENLTNCLIEST